MLNGPTLSPNKLPWQRALITLSTVVTAAFVLAMLYWAQTVFIPPTRPPFTVAPSATATPTATPTAIPAAVATATPTPIAAPTAGPTVTPAPVATPAPSVRVLLPSSSTQDLDGVPNWIFVLALAAFGLLAPRVRARERVATTPPKH